MIVGSDFMNFYSIRELRTETKNIYENILQNGEYIQFYISFLQHFFNFMKRP